MERVELPATVESIEAFRSLVAGVATTRGITGIPQGMLLMALEELLTNIVYYAYPPDAPGVIAVEIDPGDRDLVMRVRDRGAPFDMTQKPEPDLSLGVDDRPVGGLGVFLVRKVMEEVRYERLGDENVLHLHFRPKAADGEHTAP